MINSYSTPFSMNTGDIKKEIENLKNWIDADIKYQIWSLNAPSSISIELSNDSLKKDNDPSLIEIKKPSLG